MRAAVAVFFVAVAALAPSSALAFGAIAVGGPAADNALALGWITEQDSKEMAEEKVLAACRTADSSPAAQKLCKIVASFQDQCMALAADPRTGKAGFGWSVMAKQADAEREALRQCRSTPGARCKVMSECD